MIPKMSWRAALMLSVGTTLALGTISQVRAADPLDKEARRDVRVFERDLDELLIDSPYWLVPGRDNGRGYYIPGKGLLMTFQASLVSRDHGFSLRFLDRRWDWDDDEDEDERDRSDRRSRRERDADREERRYDRGKEELVDFLLEYARDLEFLAGSDTITLVAYLGDADHFWDEDLHNLVMTVRADDIRSHAAGSLSDEQAKAKITIDEY